MEKRKASFAVVRKYRDGQKNLFKVVEVVLKKLLKTVHQRWKQLTQDLKNIFSDLFRWTNRYKASQQQQNLIHFAHPCADKPTTRNDTFASDQAKVGHDAGLSGKDEDGGDGGADVGGGFLLALVAH